MGVNGPHDDVLDPPVRLDLLSAFELVLDGARVDLPASAQRVVAYLALQSRPQLHSAVASSLWTDVSGERASANLRAALRTLDGVRDRVLEVRPNRLGLSSDVVVDVRSAVRAARRLLDERRPSETKATDAPPLPALSDLELLSHDLLPEWDDDWIVFARERLRQLRIDAFEAMAVHLRRCGRYADAVEAGLVAVGADPLRESAQRALIEAHLADGNVAVARRQFEHFERLLRAELGVDPSPGMYGLVGFRSADHGHADH